MLKTFFKKDCSACEAFIHVKSYIRTSLHENIKKQILLNNILKYKLGKSILGKLLTMTNLDHVSPYRMSSYHIVKD